MISSYKNDVNRRCRPFPSSALIYYLLFLCLVLAGCESGPGAVLGQSQPISVEVTIPSESALQPVPEASPMNTAPPAATATLVPPPTFDPVPTTTSSPTFVPTETPTQTPTLTPTPIGVCNDRIPSDDTLLTLVTHEYGLSRDYQPADLVPLADYFPVHITLGYPNEIRAMAIGPLVEMVNAMEAAGLRPFIISSYRSYSSQSIAWAKWVEYNPDYASGLSARPGHSEHQLGTTVDFGSPELEAVTGIEDIEFHTYFYMTSEGAWLGEHAHEYGFIMSYPPDTLEVTGFYYEPWHFRYVGVELATQLKAEGTYLIQYLLENFPLPCTVE
jgi:D-alanyl-D-alanine carboxypeptidase